MSRNIRKRTTNDTASKDPTEDDTIESEQLDNSKKQKDLKILDKTINLKWTDWIWLSIIIIFFVGGLLYHIFSIYNIRDKIVNPGQEEFDKKQKKKIKKPKSRKGNKKHKTEVRCREILKKVFNRHFESVRPDFLKNPRTNRNLELDMYNHYLRFAVEYNGEQHYHFPNHYHKDKREYEKQIERDLVKKRLCLENGIDLLCVPYYAKDDLATYICDNIPDRLKCKMVHGIDVKNL